MTTNADIDRTVDSKATGAEEKILMPTIDLGDVGNTMSDCTDSDNEVLKKKRLRKKRKISRFPECACDSDSDSGIFSKRWRPDVNVPKYYKFATQQSQNISLNFASDKDGSGHSQNGNIM